MTHRLFINFYTAYADVFEGLGEIKGVQHKIQIDPDANPIVHPPGRVPVALCEPLKVGSISAALSCPVYVPPRKETAGRVSGHPCP